MLRSRIFPLLLAAGALTTSLTAVASPVAAGKRNEAKKRVMFSGLSAELQRGLNAAADNLPFAVKDEDWDALECYVSATFVGCEMFEYVLYCSQRSDDSWSCGCSQPNGQDCELPDLPEG